MSIKGNHGKIMHQIVYKFINFKILQRDPHNILKVLFIIFERFIYIKETIKLSLKIIKIQRNVCFYNGLELWVI